MCYRQTQKKEQYSWQWGFPQDFLFNCWQLLVAAVFFYWMWPNVACPGCCPHAGCLREVWAKRHTLSIPAHLNLPELSSSVSSSGAPVTWGKVWVLGVPHNSLCSMSWQEPQTVSEEVVVFILALTLTALRGGPSFEQVPPVCSLPGRKEEWKAMMIPFHSSAVSSSLCSCHCWLWLDITIPDVKEGLAGT